MQIIFIVQSPTPKRHLICLFVWHQASTFVMLNIFCRSLLLVILMQSKVKVIGFDIVCIFLSYGN